MKFLRIEKREAGRFIHRYNVVYEMKNGKEKIYEMISRDKKLETETMLHERPADAVVMMMHDETGEMVLLNREFRLSVGEFVYNFPAGLIDPGETPEEAAARELKEETGVKLERILEIMIPSYSAIGFSNEKNIGIVGIASGNTRPSEDPVEEITSAWYTKAEVRELMKHAAFAGRTQSYCYVWSREE